jgi:hypothetical protein
MLFIHRVPRKAAKNGIWTWADCGELMWFELIAIEENRQAECRLDLNPAYSQPRSRAIRAASTRLAAPSFAMASER